MKILVLNCGSSSLKFDLFVAGNDGQVVTNDSRLVSGIVDRIGGNSSVEVRWHNGDKSRISARSADHGQAVENAIRRLTEIGAIGGERLAATGHRIVHGGELFSSSEIVDEKVMAAIEDAAKLAPLHNAPSIAAIRSASRLLGNLVTTVAVFDTAFHRQIPDVASRYPISANLADRHGVRRYGFHGIAHRYMAERCSVIMDRPMNELRLITLQLGNGCSASAIRDGHSVDTSMGLTPLEGLMMGTRSGDVDPSLSNFLAKAEGVSVEEIVNRLNRSSGLLGVSGLSNDVRELLSAEANGNESARFALDMFCYRVRKYIGAYIAVLNGVDTIVFGGGIGENSPTIRARICDSLSWLGLELDAARNDRGGEAEFEISSDNSRIKSYVVPVDESIVIARETFQCVNDTGNFASKGTI